MDHYEVLGVDRLADARTIRRAYLNLARKNHPDAHAGAGSTDTAGAEQRMQEINAAWAVLGDPSARGRYDRDRSAESDSPSPTVTRQPAKRGWTPRADDTGWMRDFEEWTHDDDFVPPETPRTPRQQAFTMLPVVLFGISLAIGFVGLAMNARPLLAAAFVGVMLSAMLVLVLTMIEMRGR